MISSRVLMSQAWSNGMVFLLCVMAFVARVRQDCDIATIAARKVDDIRLVLQSSSMSRCSQTMACRSSPQYRSTLASG